MTKKFIPFLFALALLACNNHSSTKEEEVEKIEEPYVDPVKQQMNSAFPEVYQFLSAKDSLFNPAKFQQMSNRTIDNPGLPLPETLAPYYPLLIYNADSTRGIDLYSYNIILRQKNGKPTASHAGPDTEAALIDFKNKTRKRIYFGGSSSAVLDAKWVNNEELFLLTGEIISPTKFQPQVLHFTVSNNTAKEFIYADTVEVSIGNYPDRRLEHF